MTPDSSNIIVRSFRSLGRLLSRLGDAPKNGQTVLPRSLTFYVILIIYLLGLWLLMVQYDDDLSRWARAFGNEVPSVRYFFSILTTLGSTAWILIPTLIAGLTLSVMRWNEDETGEDKGRIRRLSGWYTDINFIFFTTLVSGLLANFIKNTIGRARPKHLDTLGHLSFDFGAFQSGLASFPSGHATTFGAFCMVLALLFPRFRWALLVLALLGAMSRVMVMTHYSSDVLAGLAFGAGFVWISARYLARRDLMFRFRGGSMPVRKR